MAGGFAKDGAVQEQIDASINDEITRARDLLPRGESAEQCDECAMASPEARRKALLGVRLCVSCQQATDEEQKANAGYTGSAAKIVSYGRLFKPQSLAATTP